MLFDNNRRELRQQYFDVWQKQKNQQPLTPLEQQIYEVIKLHPEYHKLLGNPEKNIDKDYLPEFGETNPFLHMSLHLGLREQITTDRPSGITEIFNTLCAKRQNQHEVEHQMIDCLAAALWTAQRAGQAPDETAYLTQLRTLI